MKRNAFTLVELLLALAITSILVVLLVSLVSATLGAWGQGHNRLATFSVARQTLGRISDEIGAALAATDRVEFIENDARLGTNPPVPETSENVFFVTPYPNSGAGDLCVIAYRHDATNATLERAFKESEKAWAAGAVNRFKILGYLGGPPTGLEWRKVADGVVEFELRSFAPARQTPEVSWNSTTPGIMQGKTPCRITLRVKTVDDKTLVRLNALSPGSPAHADLLLRNARDFTADVFLAIP